MAGGRIEIDVVLNDDQLAKRLDTALGRAASSAKKAAAGLGIAFGVSELVQGMGQVIATGRDFDLVMNTIAGTSGATAAQMAQISDKARQLGNDIALPATSAVDAAQAMLELSKGGLSVQASMDAARGSLALAAAAQIDAARAAEIQANAINTFGLKATDAEHVADVLANTANKSSAGITDVADALQQVGAVASGFNMTIDETAGSLAVLANNGIKGSDAGTLLKSTLLALQDTGKPATAAMETLGITTYDAQGKFVGLGKILEDLNASSKTLTEEQYNQASATLFGSDAMRLSMVAAKESSSTFRQMTKDVGAAGGAANLAAKMNEGLPGALERAKNAAESTSLALYELLRGPVTDLANFGADKLTGVADWLSDGSQLSAAGAALRPLGQDLGDIAKGMTEAGGAAQVLGDTAQAGGQAAVAGLRPLLGVAEGLVGAFADLPAPVQTTALAMGAFALARNKIDTPGPVASMKAFNDQMKVQNELALMNGQQLTKSQQIMAAYRTSTVGAVSASRNFTDQVSAIRQGASAAGQPISVLSGTMRALSERSDSLGRIGQSFTTAANNAGRFGTMAGTAAAGATAMRVGAGSLVSLLGGPMGVALGGVTMALSLYSAKQQQAAEEAARHKQIVDGLTGSFNAQTGALNSQGQSEMQKLLSDKEFGDKSTNPFETLSKYEDQWGVSSQRFVQAASGQRDAVNDLNAVLDSQVRKSMESSDAWNQYRDVLSSAGVSSQDMVLALRGNAEAMEKVEVAGAGNFGMETFSKSLDNAGKSAVQMGHQLGQANDRVRESGQAQSQQQQALLQADPAARTLAQAMDVLGDKTASAADKAKALKSALDVLTGGAEGVDAARGQGFALIEQLPAQWEAAAAAAGGFNSILDETTGRIRVDSAETRQLSSSIADVKSSMNDAASAAYKYAIDTGLSQDQARQAAVAASQEIYDGFMKTAAGARAAGVDVDGLMSAMNVLPPEKLVEFIALGSDVVKQEIYLIREELNKTPDQKSITVNSLSDEAKKKLEDIGVTVKTLPDGKVEISALTDAARARIDELLKPETKTITVRTIEEQVAYGNRVIDAFNAQQNATGGPIGYAAGGGIGRNGAIRGPGSGTSDSIATVARAGGHVFTAAEVAAAGGHDAVNEALAAAAKTSAHGYASAGPLRPVRLSNGEHYAFPEQVDAAGGHGAIFALRQMIRRGAQALSLGGVVRSEQVGKANDGQPYITGARDCSMWVSWMVQAAKGEPLGRLFTTHSLIGGQTGGLVPGASPSDLVAVGTSSEHMAATIMTANGPVNTESGGGSSPSQVRWGRGAAGAFDSQFPFRFHLPLNLINPAPTKETNPTNPQSEYISDADANQKSTGEGADGSSSQRQYIEPPKPPNLEDVAAEAAKIGVRGLLETFGLENSIFANPEQSSLYQAAQIAQNTDRYRREQSEVPSSDSSASSMSAEEKLAAKQRYENEKLDRKQDYERKQAEIRAANQDGAIRDQKLLELKQDHDRQELEAKQAYDRQTSTATSNTSDPAVTAPTTSTSNTPDPYSLVDSAPYDPARGAAQWDREAAAALRIAGMASSWKQSMIGQGDIESHGDPKAVGPNSSDGPPQGWMQVKPPTFAAYRDPKLPDDPFNVLANAVASARYADETYDGKPPWPTTAGYKNGGVHPSRLVPMKAGRADVVGPNTWRVIGDRAVNDEFYIPDTNDPQHVALGAEWARRRGFQLVQMHADGGIASRARGGQPAMATALAQPRTVQHITNEGARYEYVGPAEQADPFFRSARRHDRIGEQGAGISRVGRKGSNRR